MTLEGEYKVISSCPMDFPNHAISHDNCTTYQIQLCISLTVATTTTTRNAASEFAATRLDKESSTKYTHRDAF